MATPVNPAVVYCWPQEISVKGKAEDSTPTTTRSQRSPRVSGAENRRNPKAPQTTTDSSVPNPMRQAASQKGVIPVSATSTSGKALPQQSAVKRIATQLRAVISGDWDMNGLPAGVSTAGLPCRGMRTVRPGSNRRLHSTRAGQKTSPRAPANAATGGAFTESQDHAFTPQGPSAEDDGGEVKTRAKEP